MTLIFLLAAAGGVVTTCSSPAAPGLGRSQLGLGGLSDPFNPSEGGPYQKKASTYICSALAGSYCEGGVTAPLGTAAAVTAYLDGAAANWGCTFQPTFNAVEDLGGGNFRRFYGNQTGDSAHNRCGVAYWNQARQSAYFMAVGATNAAGAANGTDGHLYAKWLATGGPTGALGYPIANPSPASTLGVTYQLFTNGIITYASGAGAFAAGGPASSDQAVARGFIEQHHLTTGQPGVASPPVPSNALTADSACASQSPDAPTSCAVLRTGSWVPYWDVSSASKAGIVAATGYVLARTGWTTGYAIPGVVAGAWTAAFGTPPRGCPWCATFGYPLTPLQRYMTTLDPAPSPLYVQSFEHGFITYTPSSCLSSSGTPAYVAKIHTESNLPLLRSSPLPTCSTFPFTAPCQTSQSVPFDIRDPGKKIDNTGTYNLTCDTATGYYTGVAIDWRDIVGNQHHASVTGAIFNAWIDAAASTSSVEAAMAGTQIATFGDFPGMPAEDPVCRDAACTQIDQTFDNGWVYSDTHGVTYTQDKRGQLTYDRVRAKSYHNTYQHNETLWDILTYYRVRSVEFDFHTSKGGYTGLGHGNPNGADWFVYHYEGTLTDNDSRCFRLSDCLKELRAWHDANPLHEVITVFGDAGINNTLLGFGVTNPAWDVTHSPEDFDDRLRRDLDTLPALDGTPVLWRPANLILRCRNQGFAPVDLRDAVRLCGWPTLKELRGHIIWVVTSKDGTPGYGVNTYLDPARNGGHAPKEMEAFGIDEAPPGSPGNAGWDVVFYNHGHCDSTGCNDEVRQVDRNDVITSHAAGFVTRLYSNDGPSNWGAARRNQSTVPLVAPANFLATHHAADNTTFRTMPPNSRGYPFECIDALDLQGTPLACDTTKWIESSAPAIRLVGAGAANVPDGSYLGRLQDDAVPAGTRWVWSTGVVGDHLDHPGVYGCLQARLSASGGLFPFIAVCRDNRGQRDGKQNRAVVFWRLLNSSTIQSRNLDIDDGRFAAPGYDGYGLEQQHSIFLELTVFRDAANRTSALVYTSRDGQHWGCGDGSCDYTVDFGDLAGTLRFQGLAMTTNNQGIFELFYLAPRVRQYANATARYDDPADGTLVLDRAVKSGDLPITDGTGALGDFGDGLGAF